MSHVRVLVTRQYSPVRHMEATCTRCGLCLTSDQTTDGAARRLFAKMRQLCLTNQRNFYVSADVSPARPQSSLESPSARIPYGGSSGGEAQEG